MNSALERYAFPNAAQFDVTRHVEPDRDKVEAEQKAVQEATERGYADGFSQGQAAAELAAKGIFEDARQRGFGAGQNQGWTEVAEAAAALRQALDQFREWRAELVNQAETFCVDLVLAAVERLLELNETRVDFVKRTVRAAISVLAPELPHSIVVNPDNFNLVASAFQELQVRADDSIPPGGVRIEAGRLLMDGSV
ncbi:MAG: hypothetical protein JOZ29_13005, partial [Deltaproteobacteria bacterium]|nr:hypothetical protein [Deltaproteobacteria bacterium]